MSTRSVRTRAAVLLVLSLASLALIIAKGAPSDAAGRVNATDLAFRRDAAAQRRDAAALLYALDRATGLRVVRVLLAQESGSTVSHASPGVRSSPDASGAVRRHFEGDILLARIEVASGADRQELADARRLLDHGRRGIAELSAV